MKIRILLLLICMGASQSGESLAAGAQALFAHLGDGGGTASAFVLTNPSRVETASGTISFFNDAGQPLPLSLDGRPAAVAASFALKPLGMATFTTAGTGAPVSGSARITSNIPVAGVVRFSASGLGTAGVGQSFPLRSLVVPVAREAARGLNTGIAVVNALETPVDFTLTLLDRNGQTVASGTATQRLAGVGHMARFLDELFPAAATVNFQGTVLVSVATEGGRLAATAIQAGVAPGDFTALPVVAADPVYGTVDPVFPHFSGGGGFDSSITLVNPIALPVNGDLRFYDDSGRPLELAVNGASPASRISFSLPARGSALFSVGGQGGGLGGSARIGASGVIGGVLRFSSPGLGAAGVGLAPPAAALLAPVVRSAEQGINTAIALASGSPAPLALTLRDRDGEMVSGGQAFLDMQSNAHRAHFIQELFPAADTAEFEGTLSASGGDFPLAATALRVGSRAGEFTTLPVAAIRGPATPLTVPPVRLENISTLAPVASLVPPDHVFPTPHMYFYVKNDATPGDIESPVFAPADLVMTSIGLRHYAAIGQKRDYTDYTLVFSIQDELMMYFHHVRSLTHPGLVEALRRQGCTPVGAGNETFCSFDVRISIKAGQQIGTTGDLAAGVGGLDMGARDYTLAGGASAFVNPTRWCSSSFFRNIYERCYTVCPLDYLVESERSPFMSLFQDYSRTVRRTEEPRCGDVYSDIPGTAQGYWIVSAQTGPLMSEGPHLYLGASPLTSTLQEFSMGTSIPELRGGGYLFVPSETGMVNRRFSQISDERVYCFDTLYASESDAGRKVPIFNGPMLILQLKNAGGSVQIEKRTGTCGAGPWALTQARVEFVR